MYRIWELAHGCSITLSQKSVVMGILNVTPDSFSDGGSYFTLDKALEATKEMLKNGADIIDIGAESTRPDAASIDAKTEQARLLPIVKAIVQNFNCLISVDTYRAETAQRAIEAGAHIINDIWGLQKDPEMATVAAKTKAGLVIMHTGRERERNIDVIIDQKQFFEKSLKLVRKAGIDNARIVLDPGFGFAKTVEENIALIRRAHELHELHYPLLAGTSRKRFIGSVINEEVASQRDTATSATSVILRMAGFSIFRVHNIRANVDALQIADAILS